MELTDPSILEVSLLGNKGTEFKVIETDKQIENIVKALSSETRRKILAQIKVQPMDVSNIAANLQMTEANISAQIKKLEKAGLIKCNYSSGEHGVRKISSLKFCQVLIKF